MDHTPAIGDRYVLPSGRHVRIKHVSFGVEADCEYANDAGYPLLTGGERREVLTCAFLASRCVRVQCLPAEV